MKILFGTALVNSWAIHNIVISRPKLMILQFREIIIQELLSDVESLPREVTKLGIFISFVRQMVQQGNVENVAENAIKN
jgi:hypothetical protein